MNIDFGSIHIKGVGKFIVPGKNSDDRKSYCKNLLNSINGVFVPKIEEQYYKIIAIGTIEDYFILTIDGICSNEFDYYLIDGYIEDMLKLESYFEDSRYRPRLEMLSEVLSIKHKIKNMRDDEYNILLDVLNQFLDITLDLNDLEETKYDDNFDEQIYDHKFIVCYEKFNLIYRNLMKIAPYIRFYCDRTQLHDQYCLLSGFVDFYQKLRINGFEITSTSWLRLSMQLYGIVTEFKNIRCEK